MPQTKESSYTVLTLSQWMLRHDSELADVVVALDSIFGFPKPAPTLIYLEEEIEHQARLIFFVENEQILAIAGWRWTLRVDHLEAYLGVRSDSSDPDLRYELVAEVISRLEAERVRSHHDYVEYALLQYSPIDRLLGQACLDLGCQPVKIVNTFFRDHLNTRWSLRSMRYDFKK